MSVGKIKAFVQMAAPSFSLILALIPNAQAKDPLIEQMISTYQANQARFHTNYREQTLNGQATVSGIKTDPLGTGYSFYIYLDVNGSKVNCDTRDKKVAASLDKGQTVKFSGRIHDVAFGALKVSECSFEIGASAANIKKLPNTSNLRWTELYSLGGIITLLDNESVKKYNSVFSYSTITNFESISSAQMYGLSEVSNNILDCQKKQINNKSVVWYNQKNMTGGIAQTLKNNSDEWRNPHIESDKKIVQLLCSSS